VSARRIIAILAKDLRAAADLDLKRARDAAAAARLVAREKVELAVVAGGARTEILLGAEVSAAGRSLVELVPTALARAAGQDPPPRPPVRVVPAADPKPAAAVADSVDSLLAILLFILFVAMMVVPMQTATELESGTFGALRLAATGPEILAAKALAGYVYGAAGIALTVVLTGLHVDDPLLFCAAAGGLIVTLVGFGLLLGLLLPNTGALNTYAGFLVVPLVFLAGAVFTFDSGILATLLDALPLPQAVKLLTDGVSSQRPFGTGAVAWLVVGAWGIAGYALVARVATRREL